jgi:hypothetical protein
MTADSIPPPTPPAWQRAVFDISQESIDFVRFRKDIKGISNAKTLSDALMLLSKYDQVMEGGGKLVIVFPGGGPQQVVLPER